MSRFRMSITVVKIVLPALVMKLALVTTAHAGGFTPGNILVTYQGEVREYTTSGALVQTVTPPAGGATETVRDAVLTTGGDLHVYNGTFTPVVSTWDGVSWDSNSFTGWSTVNNVSYGGIAEVAGLLFVTDMATAGAGAPEGIVRFDTNAGFSAVRFADTEGYIDLNIGLDCLLYALRSNETTVDIFDPTTMASMGSVTLATGVRGIAVRADGEIFGASWDDNIYRFAAGTGAQVDSIAAGTNDLTDINLNTDGELVIGSRFDTVILTDTDLDAVSSINLPAVNRTTFVAFVGGESCLGDPVGFMDGFESGDTSAWSVTVP